MKDNNDWQLLQDYVHTRAQPAFAELVRRHLGWVRASAARQVRDPHLADDVAQAVFVALARQAPRLREGAALSTWLFQVTRYASSTALRARARRTHHERQAAMKTPARQPSMEPQQWEQLSPMLDTFISRLRADDQRAVLLRFFERKTYSEMALAMGTSEEAARKRTDRAVDRLRQMIGTGGMNLSAGALSAGLLANGTVPASASLTSAAAEVATQVADPSTFVSTISKGALQMMTLARWRLPLAACAATLLVAAVTVLAANRDAAPGAGRPPAAAGTQPASVAGTQPATAAAVDESSPKGLVVAAFRAASAGDAAGLIARFDRVTPQQAHTLTNAAYAIAAAARFTEAVEEKFGSDLGAPVTRALSVGVAERDIAEASESTDGNTASVDIGAGPGKIPLVRVDGQWKISAEVLQTLDPAALERLIDQIPALTRVTANVRAGKFKTVEDLQEALGRMMNPNP